MADIEREEMIEQAHKLYDNSRNLISELRWQKTYFCRGTNIITNQEKLFNIWIFDECLKRLEERKVGKWIYDKTIQNWRCSECNETPKTLGYVGTADFMAEHFRFCNHCGAKMEGEE